MRFSSSSILDLQSTPLGVYSNHISLSQISIPYGSAPRMLVRPYSYDYLPYGSIWHADSYTPGPVTINLGFEHFITGVLLITGYLTNSLTQFVRISFSDDGQTWTSESSLDGTIKVGDN